MKFNIKVVCLLITLATVCRDQGRKLLNIRKYHKRVVVFLLQPNESKVLPRMNMATLLSWRNFGFFQELPIKCKLCIQPCVVRFDVLLHIVFSATRFQWPNFHKLLLTGSVSRWVFLKVLWISCLAWGHQLALPSQGTWMSTSWLSLAPQR